MKKLFILIIGLMLIFSLSGCSQNSKEDINTDIINKVIGFVELSEQLRRIEINPEEFENNLDHYFVDTKIANTNHLQIFDLYRNFKNMSPEEMKQLKEDDKISILNQQNVNRELKISKVYEHKDYDWKYVFTLDTLTFTQKGIDYEYYEARRYRFTETDDGWKIRSIDYGGYSYYEGKELPKNVTKEEYMSNRLKYTYYENQPVEYMKTIDLSNQ